MITVGDVFAWEAEKTDIKFARQWKEKNKLRERAWEDVVDCEGASYLKADVGWEERPRDTVKESWAGKWARQQ